MKLIPVNYNEVNKKNYKDTKNLVVLKEFIEMDIQCAQLECADYKNANIARNSLMASIKRFNFNINVFTREGRVYLLNNSKIPITNG